MTNIHIPVSTNVETHSLNDYIAFVALDGSTPNFFIITDEKHIINLSSPSFYEDDDNCLTSTIEDYCYDNNLKFLRAFMTSDDFMLDVHFPLP